MKVLRILVALALASAVLAGCGYRGPLYLPGEEPVKKRRAPAPAPAPKPPASQAPADAAPRSATPQPAEAGR